jgi:hypothetical protein
MKQKRNLDSKDEGDDGDGWEKYHAEANFLAKESVGIPCWIQSMDEKRRSPNVPSLQRQEED